MYGKHKGQGGSEGERIFPNSRAIVLQQCGQCKRAGGMKEQLIRGQTTKSKRISCKGQGTVRLFASSTVVGYKIPRKENLPIFFYFFRAPPPLPVSLTRG